MALRKDATPHRSLVVRGRWAGVFVCAAMVGGVGISFPMWLSERAFPRTPVWSPLDALALPAPFDLLLLVIFFAALGLAAISGRRVLFGVCFAVALFLAAPDMQRWQPWYFQYTFMLGAVAFSRREYSVGTLRLIVAFTYVFSGLQKVHASYFDGGMDFFLEPFGLVDSLSNIAYVTPFIEFLVGVGLLFGRTRSLAALAAVGMHAFILLALSPFGQDWNAVVWPWNIAMMALVLILFFRAPDRSFFLSPARNVYGLIVIVLFVFMPAFGLFGLWPSYLSASLYSDNTKAALVYDGSEYVTVSSLTTDEFETPAYPEMPVYVSAARAACARYGTKLAGRPVMQVFERPGFLSGERENRLYSCSDVAS